MWMESATGYCCAKILKALFVWQTYLITISFADIWYIFEGKIILGKSLFLDVFDGLEINLVLLGTDFSWGL